MNRTKSNPESNHDLPAIRRLAGRCLRLRERHSVAEAQWNAARAGTPLELKREAEFSRVDGALIEAEGMLLRLAERAGAVTPSYIQAGSFIIAVAPDGGLLNGEEKIAIIDLRRPIDLSRPAVATRSLDRASKAVPK